MVRGSWGYGDGLLEAAGTPVAALWGLRRMADDPLNLSVVVSPETGAEAGAVERLSERAFGPGRFARTAYRIREHAAADPDLSFVARISTLLVGANRMTAIRCGAVPGLLLGPLTVDPAFRSRGIGAALVARSLAAAIAAGHGAVILVGDEAYYKRFGFARVPQGQFAMPGPVDPARLLLRELVPGAFAGAAGTVVAARSRSAPLRP